MNDEKIHSAINNRMFKSLGKINDQFYEEELTKSELQLKEPIILGLFILQYANLRMLELYYNLLDKLLRY